MPRKPTMPGVDRRQQILEAALSVFAERGFEAATNKDITERAGVNQGLIYFYFESKADVFFAAFEYHARFVMAQLDAVFDEVRDEDPAIGFGRLLKQLVAVLDQNPDVPQDPTLAAFARILLADRLPAWAREPYRLMPEPSPPDAGGS